MNRFSPGMIPGDLLIVKFDDTCVYDKNVWERLDVIDAGSVLLCVPSPSTWADRAVMISVMHMGQVCTVHSDRVQRYQKTEIA